MPSMRATVKIAGLAYCHLHNQISPSKGELQILFLHADARHKLQLIVKREQPGMPPFEATYDIPENTEITFTTHNARSVPFAAGQQPLSRIENIDRLHDPSNNLRFKPKSVDLPLSFLSIPEAICYTAMYPNTFLDFWRIYKLTTKTLAKNQRIGTVLGVDFAVDGTAGNPGYLEVKYSAAKPPVRIDYEAGAQYTITFDNECPNTICVSDFRYYYHLLEGGDTQFEETSEFPPTNPGSDTEAACNPVQGDPPGCTPFEYFHNQC